MICSCTHNNCYFIFFVKDNHVPERCPDCGEKNVRTATPEEIAWYCHEHGNDAEAG